MLQCERWGLNATQGCAGSRAFRAKNPQMQPKQQAATLKQKMSGAKIQPNASKCELFFMC
jgi:hypothetical protein